MKSYNQWYWKLYRWVKWEAKYTPHKFITGCKNIWKWFPIVWKDRDYDHGFILEVLEFKIKNTANYTEQKQKFEGWQDEVRYMRICEQLIEKIKTDYYQHEILGYTVDDLEFKPINNNLHEINIINIDDNTAKYFSKYPNTKKAVLKNPRYRGYVRSPKGLGMAMGIERHLKARKLLFKILEQKLEGWWN